MTHFIYPVRNTIAVYPFPLYAYIYSFFDQSFNHSSNIYVPKTFLGLGDRQLNKTNKVPALMELKLQR